MQIKRGPRRAAESPNGSPGGPTRRSPTPTRWIIASEGNGRLEPLCVQAGKARVLPVFGFEEEVEMFLHLGGYGGGRWHARECCADELISVLYGPCIDTESVVLDPLPGMLEDGTFGLVGVARRCFLDRLSAG